MTEAVDVLVERLKAIDAVQRSSKTDMQVSSTCNNRLKRIGRPVRSARYELAMQLLLLSIVPIGIAWNLSRLPL